MGFENRVLRALQANHGQLALADIDLQFSDLDLGATDSTEGGTLDIFPTTSARGSFRLDTINQTGDTRVTLRPAAMGQASVVSLPDPGTATCDVVLTEGAQTVVGATTFSTAIETGTTGITGANILIQSLNPLTIQLNDVDALQFDNAAIASFAAATDTVGNSVFLETEDAGATPTASRAGGLYNLKTGDGAAGATTVAAGPGGALSLLSGVGGVQSGAGASGVGGAGGAIAVTGGVGGITNNTGTDSAGAGGLVTVTAGAGGAASGAGVSNGGIGGDVLLVCGVGGAATGGGAAGVDGNVITRGGMFLQQKINTAMTTAATITDAQLFSGVITGTPTSDPDNYTTRTGTQISSAFGTVPVVGDSFEITIINIAATGNTIDLVGGTAVTLVGESVVENVTDGVNAGLPASGTWLFINTGSNAWSAYRK